MNNSRITELLRGYAIFFLCLFIFAMWGINLLSISQTEHETQITDPKESELVEEGAMRNISFKPKPFLYYYFQELGYRIVFNNGAPADEHPLMLVVDPPPAIEQKTLRDLFTWVRKGGNLLLFMPRAHQLDRVLGISRQENQEPVPNELSMRLPYFNEIEAISPINSSIHRLGGMSYYSVFPEFQAGSTVFMSSRGTGRLIVMSHPDFTSGNGLKKHDNLIMVTRIVEFLAPGRNFAILDTEPSLVIKSRARRLVKKSGTKAARTKKDHLSFFSLVKANPISWVLLQMALALTVLFASTARRFGSPLVLPDHETAAASYLRSMGQLLEEKGDTNFALSEIISEFALLAIKRYGLQSKAPFKEIIAAIRQSNIEVAESLTMVEGEIYQILNGTNRSPDSLLRVVRTIERARKELKLYD